MGAEIFAIAGLAIDFVVWGIAARCTIQGAIALIASKAFLKREGKRCLSFPWNQNDYQNCINIQTYKLNNKSSFLGFLIIFIEYYNQ